MVERGDNLKGKLNHGGASTYYSVGLGRRGLAMNMRTAEVSGWEGTVRKTERGFRAG